MISQDDVEHLKYLNAIVTNEYLEEKLQELECSNAIGLKVGTFVDRGSRFIKRKYIGLKRKRIGDKLLNFNYNGLNHSTYRDKKIVVSLTSYPARLKFVPATIGSLLQQTVKPDKIILWLGEEKEGNYNLPSIYEKIKACGVEIEYRPDIRTHTKWYYAFKDFPHDLIITVDDDVIYDPYLIEKLYSSYQKHPNYTPALRVHRMRFDNNFQLLDYNDWIWEYCTQEGMSSYQFFLTGVGGVLHQPDRYCDEVMNLNVIKKYCESEDDAWLTFMNVLSRRKIVMAGDRSAVHGYTIPGAQKSAMWKVNVVHGGSMKMIKNITQYYDNFWNSDRTLLEEIALDFIHQAE